MFDALRGFDEPVLRFLNLTLADPRLDQFWLTITQIHKLWWAQWLLGPALLVALFARYRLQALKPLMMIALAVGLTDALCYRVVKRAVQRPRPFETAGVSSWVRKVGQAHGSSFPSNHAANCYAAAGVLAWYIRRARHPAYLFASLIALSRPALGVHFPSDVVAGAALGSIVAFLITSLLIARVPELSMSGPAAPQTGDWRKRLRQARER